MPYPLSRPSFAPALASAPRTHVHQRAAELVSRYPGLSRPQLEELAAIFPRLSAMDVALMMGDRTLAPRLDAFCAANRHLISPSLADYAVIAAIMSLPFMVLFVLMIAN
jgi:hypothetical protein